MSTQTIQITDNSMLKVGQPILVNEVPHIITKIDGPDVTVEEAQQPKPRKRPSDRRPSRKGKGGGNRKKRVEGSQRGISVPQNYLARVAKSPAHVAETLNEMLPQAVERLANAGGSQAQIRKRRAEGEKARRDEELRNQQDARYDGVARKLPKHDLGPYANAPSPGWTCPGCGRVMLRVDGYMYSFHMTGCDWASMIGMRGDDLTERERKDLQEHSKAVTE